MTDEATGDKPKGLRPTFPKQKEYFVIGLSGQKRLAVGTEWVDLKNGIIGEINNLIDAEPLTSVKNHIRDLRECTYGPEDERDVVASELVEDILAIMAPEYVDLTSRTRFIGYEKPHWKAKRVLTALVDMQCASRTIRPSLYERPMEAITDALNSYREKYDGFRNWNSVTACEDIFKLFSSQNFLATSSQFSEAASGLHRCDCDLKQAKRLYGSTILSFYKSRSFVAAHYNFVQENLINAMLAKVMALEFLCKTSFKILGGRIRISDYTDPMYYSLAHLLFLNQKN